MKRKWLAIGISITAVIFLTLTSFSNVVGYQSVKSTMVGDSPLFQTRTQRATNQEQNVLTSRYLGMEKVKLLSFPPQDNKTETINKFIKIIRSMNQKTFEQLIKLYLDSIQKDDIDDKQNLNKILPILYETRKKPDTIQKYFFMENKDKQLSLGTIFKLPPYGKCIVDYISAIITIFLCPIVAFIRIIIGILKHSPTNLYECFTDGGFCP